VETGSHEPEPELLGLVTRATLLDLLEEMVNSRRSSERSAPHLRVPASVMDQHVNFLGTGMMIGADELGTVPAHVPASRVYRMFSLMGVRRVIVVQSGGGNRLGGVITRRDLLDAIEEEEDLGDGGAEREMRRRRARGGGSGPRQRRRPAGDGAQGGGLLTTRPRASWASGWEDSRTGRSLPATVEH
jgi:CBS domain-containing protein